MEKAGGEACAWNAEAAAINATKIVEDPLTATSIAAAPNTGEALASMCLIYDNLCSFHHGKVMPTRRAPSSYSTPQRTGASHAASRRPSTRKQRSMRAGAGAAAFKRGRRV